MTDLHRAYLSLGSNIEAEKNLPQAVQLLREVGQVVSVSRVWESESIGFDGPNFLNGCVLFLTPLQPIELKEKIIRPIEAKLGRIRGTEKNAPRTIDIDIEMYAEQPLNTEFWDYPFVAIPLAELIPDFQHPLRRENLSYVAAQLRSQVWIIPRVDVQL